ncbi:MAG: hypothetical protein PHD48_04150 [Alphaproteobacteria bacterium]|nr:hypothetical protein [Alphaproteobacteria bacterium]
MDQVQSSTASIQNVNAALLAQYRATQASVSHEKMVSDPTSFVSLLQNVEPQAPAAPIALTAKTSTSVSDAAKAAALADSALVSDQEEATESCAQPKISRSARMACAEKATEVAYEDDDFSLGDLVDLLNPLQHIPVIGSIYRELTGDEIKPDVQVAGSLLFGVATGSILLSAATGIASAAFEQQTGKEPTIQLAESVFGSDFLGLPDPLTEQKIVLVDAGGTEESDSPVQEASVEKVVLADAATTAVVAGTAETLEAAVSTNKAIPGLLSSTGGMRIGNTIYTSRMMRSGGKRPVTTSIATANSSTTRGTVTAQSSTSTQKASAEDTTLAALIQEQAAARDAGQTLAPERIQDIMLKALDKYKMAHANTSMSAAATAVQ